MSAVSIRGDWVGRSIDGKFPLISWLGGSGATGVFLTEIAGKSHVADEGSPSSAGGMRAAIKLAVASQQTEERLAMWNLAATLSHPHVAQIFQTGHAQVDETKVVYIVFELAEEILAQIIPERALTSNEAREMLNPMLDALAYLHGKEYVHAHLKPSNILVIENEIKLSSDGFVVAGSQAGEDFSNELHNAPEIHSGPVTPAADMWSLGVTLVESLTRQMPIWDAATDAEAEVPATLPRPFAEIARGCLRADPAERCTVAEVRAMLDAMPESAVPVRAMPAVEPEERNDAPAGYAERRKIPVVPLVAGLVLLVAIIIGLAMRSHKPETAPIQTETTQPATPAEPQAAGTTQPAAGASAPAEAIDRVVPDVPRSASNTIQGKVSVSVRVNVDESGTVSNAELVSRGPSAYFARLALESARNWKFKPAQNNAKAVASTWMLHYAFRRDGTDVKPEQIQP